MRKKYLLILLTLLFSLIGCPQNHRGDTVNVNSRNSDNLHLIFGDPANQQKSWGESSETQSAKIRSVSFSRNIGKQNAVNWRGEGLWQLDSLSNSGEELSELTYGKTPKGFIANTPQKIYPGDEIMISIDFAKENNLDNSHIYSRSIRLKVYN